MIELIAHKLAMKLLPKLMGISDASAIMLQTMERELRLRILPNAIGRNQAEGDIEGGNDEGDVSWSDAR